MGCANGEGYETCKSSTQSPSHHSGPCVWPNTDGSLHCLKQPWRNKSPHLLPLQPQTCISEVVNIFSIMEFITFVICKRWNIKADIKQLHNYEADQLIINNNWLFKAVGNKELHFPHRTFRQNLIITTECSGRRCGHATFLTCSLSRLLTVTSGNQRLRNWLK